MLYAKGHIPFFLNVYKYFFAFHENKINDFHGEKCE